MNFAITHTADKKKFILKNNQNDTEVEIFTFGALLNKFIIQKGGIPINVIDGFTCPEDAEQHITDSFKSAKLSPFVCRLDKAAYSFEGKNYTIKKHFSGDSAIHGLLYNAVFTVVSTHIDESKATLILRYKYDNLSEGFPFAYSIEVSYKLNNKNQLIIDTEVTNLSQSDMPLNDGWHPYFKMGDKINDAEIRINSKELVEFNEQLLPNGKYSTYNIFNEFKIFGNTFLDNCFTLNNTVEPAFQMRDNTIGIQLNIYPAESYPYLQIYSSPSRESIAIENLSSIPDSFNNQTGLIVLKPNSSKHFSTMYELKLI